MDISLLTRRLGRMGLLAGLLAWPALGWAQSPVKRFQQGPTNPFVIGVGGQGRIVPAGGLLRLTAQPGMQGGAIVQQLLVNTGDWVDEGQLLAVLNTHSAAKAQADAAQAQATAAAAGLDQAKAAALQAEAELAAQLTDLEGRAQAAKATAHLAAVNSALALQEARAESSAAQTALDAGQATLAQVAIIGNATVAVAQAQYDDVPRLSSGERKIAAAGLEQAKASIAKANTDAANQVTQLELQRDAAVLKEKQAEASLVSEPTPADPGQWAPVQVEAQVAQANFDAEKLVRDAVLAQRAADVAAAQAKLAAASADAAAAQAQVVLTEIHAPYKGRILGIHAQPGELVGPLGVFDFGDTRDMFVDTEVGYDDAINVHVGQKATISCDALPTNNTGVVVEVGAMVGNNQLQNLNPTAFTDPRIVMVKIHLDNPTAFANLVNGQVTVRLVP